MTAKRVAHRTIFLVLVTLPFATMKLAAQPSAGTSTIRGTVVSAEASSPVAGASVTLVEMRRNVMTGADGSFAFDSVPAGSYHVEARKVGYAPLTTAIQVTTEEKPTTFAMRLMARPQELAAVEVRDANRPSFLAAVQERVDRNHGALFTADDIKQRNPVDTKSLLERLPGVHINDRGLSFARCSETSMTLSRLAFAQSANVQVYVDGVRMTNTSSVRADTSGGNVDAVLRGIHPLSIEAMEVYSGVGRIPAEYLSDACAVIAIWTKRR